MSKPFVSILINNYNYERFVGEAIASALNQTYARIEVIVVDDGSSDNSRRVIESYGKDVLTVFKPNEGQASAFNVGFAKSAGSIVCILDSDDLFLPTKVAEIVDAYEEEPAAGWCFHPLQWVNAAAQTIPGSPDLPYATGHYDFRREYLRGKAKFYAPPGLTFSRSLLEKLLPIPQYVLAPDNYLKFSAPAFVPGFYISKCLGLQRIHGANIYTAKKDPLLKATFQLSVARGLRDNFPELTRVANKLFANGIAAKGGTGADFQELSAELRQYLVSRPLAEKIEVLVHTAYRILHPYHLDDRGNFPALLNRPIQSRRIH
jgi:glycosyltransferase involved in cell wall biosynthesis